MVTVILYDAVKYLGGPKQSYGTPPLKKENNSERPVYALAEKDILLTD